MGNISAFQFAMMQARCRKTPFGFTGTTIADEHELHELVSAECKRRGWITLHGSMAQATARTIGEWDFVIIADEGRTFLVECKSKNGKLTPEQAGMKLWAEKLGHKPAVVRSMDEFLALITKEKV